MNKKTRTVKCTFKISARFVGSRLATIYPMKLFCEIQSEPESDASTLYHYGYGAIHTLITLMREMFLSLAFI